MRESSRKRSSISRRNERRRVGKDVVFQNDCLFHLLKCPVETADRTFAATQVDIREVGENFTGPIHLCGNLPTFAHNAASPGLLGRGPSATTSKHGGRAWAMRRKTASVCWGRLKTMKTTGVLHCEVSNVIREEPDTLSLPYCTQNAVCGSGRSGLARASKRCAIHMESTSTAAAIRSCLTPPKLPVKRWCT